MSRFISVILPIYNEVENIEPCLAEIESALRPTGDRFEIIAVDDGSTDGSTAALEKAAAARPHLKVIAFRRNAGQAAAFDAGFRHASGDVVVTMDADLQNDANDIPRLLAELDKGYDFVSGWRKKRRDGFILRRLPSVIANRIIRLITKTRLHDLGCSLKVYRKFVTEELRLYGEMHRFIGVMVQNMGARVGEQVVNHRPRTRGTSKYGLSRTIKVLLDLFNIWFMRGYQTKPIYIFGGTGVVMLFSSAALSLYVIYEKIRLDVYVHRNPLFVISMIFAVVGIQFLGLGIIAEIIIRTYFEAQNKPAYYIGRTINL